MTVGTVVVCAIALVTTLVDDPGAAVRLAPGLALASVLVWALFGRPAVVVHAGGVRLENVLRTIELPWPSVQRIDTKYALTLVTAYGVYAAWAAPAPSRSLAARADRERLGRHLPESTYGLGGVRPGDLPGTPSGDVAALVRHRWEELRDAGHLDDPRLEREKPVTRWNVAPVVSTAVLAVLTTAAVVL
ncbi:hypothetical protein Q760_00670 [Cellulomonas cellasea DSM 20118]|uniref:Low molecular weight protein antigen 6 PH domain-containing protein n=2 Tax=Cellulomonas cellasea TaxID=43670 RepID=A0A0A0B8I1_9CELL|nr:hypothetical protein Q760_00670 [Cellulomonas cellasea DSM 20118]